MTGLSQREYEEALAELAEYERRIAESDRLSQRDTMRVAETLDRLYRDQRWVDERNAERTRTAKTPRGGRPVDPTSRSQFSTWIRERYNRFAPQVVYRLLDAQAIKASFLTRGEITPTQERQLRPLKPLLSVANGQGARIPEVWDIACKLAADAGRDQPSSEDVKAGIAEWRRLHLTAQQQRQERAVDRAWVTERKAEAAWKQLLAVGADEHINAFIDCIRRDIEQYEKAKT